MRLEAEIEVLAGPFASQQLAFAHLLDVAEQGGLSPDFDHVEVISPPHGARLRGYFDADVADGIAGAAGTDAVILVLPGALVTGRFEGDGRMRRIGRHVGRMIRA